MMNPQFQPTDNGAVRQSSGIIIQDSQHSPSSTSRRHVPVLSPVVTPQAYGSARVGTGGATQPDEFYGRGKDMETARSLRGDGGKSKKSSVPYFLVSGVGFFNDAYDLLVMNVVNVILTEQYGKAVYTSTMKANASAAAIVGAIFGQLFFGFVGDWIGRKLNMIISCSILIVGGILCASATASTPEGTLWFLIIARGILGFGIGGEYPLAASATAEDAETVESRNRRVATVFSMQGLGFLTSALAGNILVGVFASGPKGSYDPQNLEIIWRFLFAIGVLPALFILFFRWNAEEPGAYQNAKEKHLLDFAKTDSEGLQPPQPSSTSNNYWGLNSGRNTTPASTKTFSTQLATTSNGAPETGANTAQDVPPPVAGAQQRREVTDRFVDEGAAQAPRAESSPPVPPKHSRSKRRSVALFFFILRHYYKGLIGTAGTWFLFDIVFYALNLFQASILSVLGVQNASLVTVTTQNVLVSLLALPGYFVAVCFINKLGRKKMQLQGFTMMTLLFIILGALWNQIKTIPALFIILYGASYFFSNFGPNTSTFIFPTEMFPTPIRATCHGISAACGKAGAAIGAFGFVKWVEKDGFGYPGTFYTFAGICFASLPLTWFFCFDNPHTLEALDAEHAKKMGHFDLLGHHGENGERVSLDSLNHNKERRSGRAYDNEGQTPVVIYS